jgi:hypothetical protein
MREGAEANAVVIDHAYWESTGGVDLTLRVQFGDGKTIEIARNEGVQNVGSPSDGDILPMRYDPDDRSQVEIDIPKLREKIAREKQQRRHEAVSRGEAQLAGDVPRADSSEEQAMPPGRAAERIAAILELKKAHDAGTITEAEFQARKAGDALQARQAMMPRGAERNGTRRPAPDLQHGNDRLPEVTT